MATKARIITIGDEQAVLLPDEYRFETWEVSIRRDAVTGDAILSSLPSDWEGLFKALGAADFPEDFLSPEERAQGE